MANTLATILGDARTYANTDSNGLTDTDGITLSNEALLDFRAWLIEQGVSAGNVVEVNKNATSQKGIYSWSSDLSITDFWMLKTMGVNYQDTSNNNYVPVTQIDLANLTPGTSVKWLRNNQSKTMPLIYLSGNSFEVLPAPNSSNGDNLTSFFNILYFQQPTVFAATTDSISYPESLDYRVLSYRIASKHQARKGSPLSEPLQQEYMKRANRILQIIRQGTQEPFKMQGLNITGWEY